MENGLAENSHMFKEAAVAPACVEEQLRCNHDTVGRLARRLRSLSPRVIFTCARGSSGHAATYAKYLFEVHLGIPVVPFAPSVSSMYGKGQFAGDSVVLAISQSGASPDILSVVTRAKTQGALTIALTNCLDSPLARLADEVLPMHAGREQSVAATKSYITSLTAIASLVAHYCQDGHLLQGMEALPEQLASAWQLKWTSAEKVLSSASNMYVLGRGAGLGIAREAALKFKECCGLHAEAFSAAEVIHGPLALVREGFPVLIFAQTDEMLESLVTLAQRCEGQGARCLVAGTGAQGSLPTIQTLPALEPILQIQSFYRLVVNLAVARGHDPDTPPHLSKVTETL